MRAAGSGDMDDITGPAKLLRIYIGESDKWQGRPLSTALVERLRAEGLAGATVIRAVEGFGANSRIHTAHILRLSEDLPLVVECVDRPDRIDAILPVVDEMVGDGMVTIEDVQVVHYRHAKDA
jgi:PII-like signaling protein